MRRSIQSPAFLSESLKGRGLRSDAVEAGNKPTEDSMKITRTNDIQPVVQSRSQGRGGKAGGSPPADGGPTRASLSKDAGFVNSVRNEAAGSSDVRSEKVAEAKSLLASGSLESSVNMNEMLDSVMADL